MTKSQFTTTVTGALAALLIVALIAMAPQVQPASFPQPDAVAYPPMATPFLPLTITGPVCVKGIPLAKNMVFVRQSAPFTVPSGKTLVITGIGSNNSNASGWDLVINGVQELAGVFSNDVLVHFPTGLAVGPGTSVIPVVNSGNDGVLMGYLEDIQ